MVTRVFIGNDPADAAFKMRVSRPGFDARFAAPGECVIHENLRPLTYVTSGYLTVPDGGDASVGLGQGFAFPPLVILRCASNRLTGPPGRPGSYHARLNLASGVLTLTNNLGYQDTFRYAVFFPN